MDANFDNKVNFLPNKTANTHDGAIYYSWDGNPFNSNLSSDSGSNSKILTYAGNGTKDTGLFTLGVKSVVPTTASTYEYAGADKDIFVSSLMFTAANTCPAGFDCP